MKLELKHLAPYLPYKLKAVDYFEGMKLEREIVPSNIMAFVEGDTKAKPILRPLSDLHSEFIIGDIYPFNSLSKRSRMDLEENNVNPLIMKYAYEDIQILLEYHYDVFGLIKKGLAIDINTLTND